MEERSQQVQFMNRIYKSASHVLVWLGADEGGIAKAAFQLVHELNETFGKEDKRAKFDAEHADTRETQDWLKQWLSPLDHLTRLTWVIQTGAPFLACTCSTIANYTCVTCSSDAFGWFKRLVRKPLQRCSGARKRWTG